MRPKCGKELVQPKKPHMQQRAWWRRSAFFQEWRRARTWLPTRERSRTTLRKKLYRITHRALFVGFCVLFARACVALRGDFHFLSVPHINNRPLKTVLSYAKSKIYHRVGRWRKPVLCFNFQMAGRQIRRIVALTCENHIQFCVASPLVSRCGTC
jgi:hypothetical protein